MKLLYFRRNRMLKFFTNLIFILMLFILLSGMPLNIGVLDINPLKPSIETPIASETPVNYILSDSITLSSINPEAVEVEVLASDNSTPSDDFLASVSVGITAYDVDKALGVADTGTQENEDLYLYTTTFFPLDTLAYSISSTDNESKFKLKIQLDQIESHLVPGYYHVDITSDYNQNPVTSDGYFTWYDEDLLYLGASDDEINGRLTMTLYIPTEDYQYLVPISKRVPYPTNRSRTLYRQLHAGAIEELNLINEPTMPYASRIYINSGIASIYIYSPEQEGYEEQFETVIEAITNSMTSLDFISEATFYIDGKQNMTFGNVDLTQHFTSNKENIAYIGYSNASNYIMLLPIHLSDVTSIDADRYQMMLQILKGDNVSYPATVGLLPTVPAQIELESYNLTDGLLTLDLNASFTSIYNDLPLETATTYAQLMVDSILYSFTSFDDVTQVAITADGKSIADYYGVDLSKPLIPKHYINMEPEL